MQDHEPPPTMADVARLIAGKSPPPWLIAGLQRCAGAVNQNRLHGDATPLVQMRERLDAIARAAELLTRGLIEVEMLSYLERDGTLHEMPAARRTLQEIGPRARKAMRELLIRPGQGWQGPNPDGLDARKLCALIVVEAWSAARGKYPGDRNGAAQAAADAYWQASGGPSLGEIGSVERWRRDFAHVLRLQSLTRDLVRQRIQEDRPAE